MKKIILTIHFIIISMFINVSYADDVYIVIMKKQEQKKQRGWSLANWMETKRVIDQQNQWLALNSSATLLEFFVDAHVMRYSFSDTQDNIDSRSQQGLAGTLGAYVSIFGVEYEYEKTNEEYTRDSVLLALRIFGTAEQGTSLTFAYGFQSYTFDPEVKVRNNFWQAKINMNITSFLGLEGIYREYISKETLGIASDGRLIEYGAYVDVNFIRLFGTKFRETLDLTGTDQIRDGYNFGVKLFF